MVSKFNHGRPVLCLADSCQLIFSGSDASALKLLTKHLYCIVVQVGGEIGVTNPQLEKMKNVMRGAAVLLIPISATFPAVSEVIT